ncbi:hypothetical protein [Methanolobus sp.]|uniref:hypothetical protein n=1 Tax=Methanolobus sp. TaxID=1874737 RepID=UPI0025891F05|nr:hypothetical protein [Methanolobus sp.]
MSDMKDTLKEFIDSRLQEATRAQAIYPDRVYVASGFIRQLNSEKLRKSSEPSSCDPGFKDNDAFRSHSNSVSAKKDFMW